MTSITIDGIDFQPVRKHQIIIPNYYVSKCGKVYNTKRERYVKPYDAYRGKKSDGYPPKCKEFSVITEGQPFWDKGHKYNPKKGKGTRIEFKIKLHQAVLDGWSHYEIFLNTLSKEELISLSLENMMIDHINDNPLDNRCENLQYSTPLKNSNHRKKWK